MRDVRAALGPILFAGICLVSSASADDSAKLSPSSPSLQNAGALCRPDGAAGSPPTTLAAWTKGARIFEGLGSFHFKVSTRSPEAQAYFDQGMRFLWAFNHDEATRSFARAAEIDPACALCYWGVALTVGPNYNLPAMASPRAAVAWEALLKAEKNAAGASPREQALIAALGKRYDGPKPIDSTNETAVLTAYANAMRQVARRYPDDPDIQTLFAESLMNINAWKLWSADGKPAAGTEEVVATLEAVLAKWPTHPGANHYYVHAIEASPHPEKAVAAAERLSGMMPAAGHLEHMPAHIMQRVGRYEAAAEANRKGAAADIAYFTETRPPDYYVMYTAHNYKFLAFSTAMEGRRQETIEAVRKLRALIPDAMMRDSPGSDWNMSVLYAALVRFGLWDQILAEPAPDARLPELAVGYHYARASALAARGRVDEAKAELAEIQRAATATPATLGAGLNLARNVNRVAEAVATARIAAAEGKQDAAVAALEDAVAREDALDYNEPADWFFPVRHLLGAALLKAGRAADAEAVYRADLRVHPANGWALFGLAQSLDAQGRKNEAAAVRVEFDQAWRLADTALTASAF